VLTTKFPCLQEMPPSDPVEQGDEGDRDTVGEAAGGSRSPAPTLEELLAQMERPPPCDNPPRKIPYYRLRPIHFGP
jgi:hypothetical protein